MCLSDSGPDFGNLYMLHLTEQYVQYRTIIHSGIWDKTLSSHFSIQQYTSVSILVIDSPGNGL